MKFDTVPSNLTVAQIEQAQDKLYRLAADLAVHPDNKRAGSHRGGNPEQLLSLIVLEHRLFSATNGLEDVDTMVSPGSISWSYEFLTGNSLSFIRDTLDKIYPSIVEKNGTPEFDNEYDAEIPIELIKRGEYKHSETLSREGQLVLASALTRKLAADLDNGDTTLVNPIGEAIFAMEWIVAFIAIRNNLGLSRIDKHDIDVENEIWNRFFFRVSGFLRN